MSLDFCFGKNIQSVTWLVSMYWKVSEMEKWLVKGKLVTMRHIVILMKTQASLNHIHKYH